MADFDLILAFVAAGLHKKGVLRAEGDNQLGYSRTGWWRKRLVPNAPVEVTDDGTEVRRIEVMDRLLPRDIENELLRQMTEYADAQGVVVGVYFSPIQVTFLVGRAGDRWLLSQGVWGTEQDDADEFESRPEALLAACVAVAETNECPSPT